MSTVSDTSSSAMVQSNDNLRNSSSSAGATDLAQGTKNTTDTSRVTPAKEAGNSQKTKGDDKTQQAGSDLRPTPPEADTKDTKESLSSSLAPKEDKVTLRENAPTPKNSESAPVGETPDKPDAGNFLNIKA